MKAQNNGFNVKDCGKIRNVNEIAKYVTKPAVSDKEKAERPGLVGTADIAPERVLWLHESTRLLHFWQPYHEFREWCSDLVQSRRRLYRERSTGDIVKVPRVRVERMDAVDVSRENIWIGTTLPATRFGPLVEPVLLVLNYTENPLTESGKSRLCRINMFKRNLRANAVHASSYVPKTPPPPSPPIKSTTGQQLDKRPVPDWVPDIVTAAFGPPLECVAGPP